MRKIQIQKWKANTPNGEMDESLLNAITVLINTKRPEEMPRGLDNFNLMSRLSKAFDIANSSGVLALEESEYKFVKDMVEKDIPANWGANLNLVDAIKEFMSAKEE